MYGECAHMRKGNPLQAFSNNRIIMALSGHPGAAIETAALLSPNPESKAELLRREGELFEKVQVY